MTRMLLKLVTPERIVFEEEVMQVTLPTESGEITILPNHVPIVSNVTTGVAEFKRKDGHIEDLAISGGIIQVSENGSITVLAETAERGEELNIQAIEEAREKAERLMRERVSESAEAFAEAAAMLEQELARYKAANKYRQRKGIRTTSVREERKLPNQE